MNQRFDRRVDHGGRTDHSHSRAGTGIGLALLALTIGASTLLVARSVADRSSAYGGRYTGSAPEKALRRNKSQMREGTLVGRTVTIRQPRKKLYAFWRDFTKLPEFMEHVRRVTIVDDTRSRWVIAGPGGTEIEFGATIVEERSNEVIAWQSDEDAPVRNSGRIEFRDAPGKRGTEVAATIAYDPPGGAMGRIAAKLFQQEPNIQARRDLKRFKQLMETGEIADTEPGPAAPRA